MVSIDFKKEFEDNLGTLAKLLQIPSIYDEKTANNSMPYGLNVYKAFDFMKTLAEEDGFIVKEYNNEALSVSYLKNDENRIDIASHLDVVSVDDSWTCDPFGPTIKDGKIVARGACDMKVALFLTYIALKLLRKNHPDAPNEIRLVFGTDEERTMHDMHTYYSMVNEPKFAFSPDGKFPMAIGEKGALMWTLNGDYDGVIEELNGGIQCNIVAPHCKVVLKDTERVDEIKKYISKNKLDAEVEIINNRTVLEVNGIAVHCSRNWQGINATVKALEIIKDVYRDELADNLFNLFNENFGKGLDGYSGKNFEKCMTVNLGVLKIEKGKVSAQVDARYPSTITSEKLTDNLKKKCIINVSLDYDDPPTLCDRKDPYIRTLLSVYRKITHDYSKPRISGGVSYSKVFKHCVTFGMSRVNGPTMAHQKDEYVEIQECITALEVYYRAMEKLAYLEV